MKKNLPVRCLLLLATISAAAVAGADAAFVPSGLKTPARTAAKPESATDFELIEFRMRRNLLPAQPVPLSEVRAVIVSQRPDGTFENIDYGDENRSAWKVARHLSRIQFLARAWASTPRPFKLEPALGDSIRRAVNWWSTRRPQCSNWWWNDMGVPQSMANILLLTPELFPPGAERDAALKVCRQAEFQDRYTGNNRVFIASNIFRRAVLERDTPTLERAAAVIAEEIRMAPSDNPAGWDFGGIRSDGCYHQHGPQIQFGNYGGEFFANIGYWANIWKDTRLQLSPGEWRIMRLLAFDGFQWVLWRGEMDLLACGRQLGRGAAAQKGKQTLAAFDALRQADDDFAAAYLAVSANQAADPNRLVGNRHFWNSDYMVHRRPAWYAAVRMNSQRVRPIEDDTNFDNALGRYFSDGVCLVMRSGKEYEDITACWDWTRLPGATLPKTPVYTEAENRRNGLFSGKKPLHWSHSTQFRRIGETDFVGGVTDGIHGVAVFTMNLDGVEAKKGYFFDTGAIYQLGNGITSTSPFRVATTVNCCRRNGEIKQGENWLWHDNIGYRGEKLKLETGLVQGDWRWVEGGLTEPSPVELELFKVTVEHGIKPENAAYQFTILPGATAAETAGGDRGKVLAATAQLQAVEFEDGAVGAIFYQPGRLGNFVTASPGVFLIAQNQIFAADPTAKLSAMTVTLNGRSRTFELPAGEAAGSSVKVTF